MRWPGYSSHWLLAPVPGFLGHDPTLQRKPESIYKRLDEGQLLVHLRRIGLVQDRRGKA
jgi:hypothetical protein